MYQHAEHNISCWLAVPFFFFSNIEKESRFFFFVSIHPYFFFFFNYYYYSRTAPLWVKRPCQTSHQGIHCLRPMVNTFSTISIQNWWLAHPVVFVFSPGFVWIPMSDANLFWVVKDLDLDISAVWKCTHMACTPMCLFCLFHTHKPHSHTDKHKHRENYLEMCQSD